MISWIHKLKCWLDDRAHMILWGLSSLTEGADIAGYAAPITDLIGQHGFSFIVLALAGLGMWRSKITHARGKEMKAQVSELKQQVEATGQTPAVPER